jgi:hypothetical protein
MDLWPKGKQSYSQNVIPLSVVSTCSNNARLESVGVTLDIFGWRKMFFIFTPLT